MDIRHGIRGVSRNIDRRRSHLQGKQMNQNYTETELTGLVKFDAARQAIEVASTVDEVKYIRDRAEAMRAYAKQSHLSLGMQNQCAEIKVRAERKAGELLKKMDLHEGGRPTENLSHDVTGFRLCDFGINRMQSSRWQQISSIPEKDFEERLEDIKKKGHELTTSDFLSLAGFLNREREQQERREKSAADAALVEPDDHITVLHGDFRKVLNEDVVPNDSVSLVLTDPMYGREYLPLWEDLGRFASRVLKTGNLLVAYTGQMYLPQVIHSLEKHLKYVWTAGIKYSIANAIFPLKINNCLKLVLLFSKGDYTPTPNHYWFKDHMQGDAYLETKVESELQQGLHEAEYLIETFTNPGDLVVDPFLGTGTVAVAAKRKQRRFIGSEILKERFDLSLSRISQDV
jgi:hypothetical protein